MLTKDHLSTIVPCTWRRSAPLAAWRRLAWPHVVGRPGARTNLYRKAHTPSGQRAPSCPSLRSARFPHSLFPNPFLPQYVFVCEENEGVWECWSCSAVRDLQGNHLANGDKPVASRLRRTIRFATLAGRGRVACTEHEWDSSPPPSRAADGFSGVRHLCINNCVINYFLHVQMPITILR